MPYRQETFAEREYYHVYNRGALRNTLFYNHLAYRSFIDLIDRYAVETSIQVIAVCLMPNHFHLLVQIGEGGDLSQFMKRVCQAYSKRANRELRRAGTVIEGRFKSKHVKFTEYLTHLCRYIHANPIKAGLAQDPREWPYSNFKEFIGIADDMPCDRSFVNRFFLNASEYEASVIQYAKQTKIGNEELAAGLASFGAL